MEASIQWIFDAAQQAKLHKEMCRRLARVVNALVQIFPSLEAVRPGCRPGIQALSALHLALEKAKSLLHYCANSSKLYLAMTGDSIVLKFGRVRSDLDQNLIQLADIVSESLSNKIASVLTEVRHAKFLLDPLDKQVGADIISLLVKEKGARSGEHVMFEQVATKLGFLSPKSVLEEQQAIKKLIEKAHSVGDKKKASILSYFLHLLKHYSKNIKSNSLNAIRVEKELLSSNHLYREAVTKSNTTARSTEDSGIECLQFKRRHPERLGIGRSMSAPVAPEEFRCPISLQLMSEPVVIASGLTYERVCIEKWFQEGHDTCPKTQQKLPDLSLTQNTCVKNLIESWCQKNGVLAPEPPSPTGSSVVSWNFESFSSLDTSSGIEDNGLDDGMVSHVRNEEKHATSPIVIKVSTKETGQATFPSGEHSINSEESSQGLSKISQEIQDWWLPNLEQLFTDLSRQDWQVQCRAAKNIRMLTRDIPKALAHVGDNRMAVLVDFLGSAVSFGCIKAQETGVLILLDLCIFDRNNEIKIVASGAVPYLLELLQDSCELSLKKIAMSVLMVLSCAEENRIKIGLSGAIPILVDLLDAKSSPDELDTLTTLCNLSTVLENQQFIIHADAASKLVHFLKIGQDHVPEKCLILLHNISSLEEGRYAILGAEGCITAIVEFLEIGTIEEQEHAAAVLLLLCIHSFTISQLIWKEGVTPSLVSLSVHGSHRGKDTACRLLQLFHKQQRQKENVWPSKKSDSLLQEHPPRMGHDGKDEIIGVNHVIKSCSGSSSLLSQSRSLPLTRS